MIEMGDAGAPTGHITLPESRVLLMIRGTRPPASYGYFPLPSPERRPAKLCAKEIFQLRAQWRQGTFSESVRIGANRWGKRHDVDQ